MKKQILISLMLVSISIFYSFNKNVVKMENAFLKTGSGVVQDSFLLGAMYDSRDSIYTYLSDTLGFNVWHKYTAPNGWGWPVMYSNSTLPADVLDTPVYRYTPDIIERLDTNKANNLLTLLDRPKFEYLAFGQRSDYQCENISKVDPDYWFYTYHNSTDNGITIKDTLDYSNGGSGYVKRCLYNQSNPGTNSQMLFDSLRGNLEQINTFWGVTWLGDSHYGWYIMPRIRIDSAFANNPANQDVNVCKIIIKNRDGDSLTQVIKVKHFKPNVSGSIYHGDYLEIFNNYDEDPLTNLFIPAGNWFNNNPDVSFGDLNCRVDFKVFWYDKCDMWIDRVRVENEPAHQMLTLHLPKIEEWIRAEVQDIAMAEINSGNQSPYKFYIEEFEMNHLPCIGYLNKKIIEYSNGRLSLMVNYNHDLVKAFIPDSWSKLFSPAQVKKYLIDSAGIREIFTECYNLEGWRNDEHNGGRESYVPSTLYNGDDYQLLDGILAYVKSPSEYDDWIQEHFDNYGVIGLNLKHILQFSDTISRIGNVPFQYLHQSHLWIGRGHMLKEPTNEEMILTSNLAISYGAKGILYFAWDSNNNNFDTSGSKESSRGLTNHDDTPRRSNVYGQNKWEAIKLINTKIKKWDSYLMEFNSNRSSYIVRLEKSNLINETFFRDIYSYEPLEQNFPSHEPNPESESKRYLQVARFNNPNSTYEKYFMIVNRRCSPFFENDPGIESGIRFVKIKLDSSHSDFNGFNNWSIIDLENDSLIKTFDKQTTSTIDLGWYLPGEGKLYKIAPVMQEGGTLVTNEVIQGGNTFNCNGDVNNNGYDINVYSGTTINFADGVGWNVDGGEFITGLDPQSPDNLKVNLQAQNGAKWTGINFSQSTKVNIHKTVFSNIKKISSEETNPSALQFVDCYDLNVSSSEFNFSNLDSLTCININYLKVPEEFPINIDISYNVFNTGSNKFTNLICNGFAEATIPLIINGNTFNSSTGNIAIFLSNVSAGVIKNNTLNNYKTSINIISSASYADLYNNNITGDSIGVQIIDGTINLGMQGASYTGGLNIISSDNISAKNLNSVAGYFTVPDGNNTFEINNSSAYHFNGTFSTSNPMEEYAGNNCFKLSGSQTTPTENVDCSSGLNCIVDFIFDPVNCGYIQPSEYLAFDMGGGNYDTIFVDGDGMGGGKSNIGSSKMKTISGDKESSGELTTVRELYADICLEMRKRNYELVHTKSMELLNNYIDSVESIDVLSKLYQTSLMLDNAGDKMGQLKTYYETLILNNGQNEALVRKLYYLIQKCKVSLGQYQSAMNEFQQIVNQNPFNYEGLVASWDYAATSLLDSIYGTGGGEREFGDDPEDRFDKKSFTRNDRKVIRENIVKSFESSRTKEFEKMKELQEKISEGTASKNEKAEFESKKRLSEVVKINRPADVIEHLNTVNTSINKIFNKSVDSDIQTENKNLIPTEYNLSQNYPNPFNPATKINFELPEYRKVNLVIYDMLGREILRIISNELKTAGRYTVEFSGVNLASGVYFYRLEAGKFVQTKRMVLIK